VAYPALPGQLSGNQHIDFSLRQAGAKALHHFGYGHAFIVARNQDRDPNAI
jgi:hypothetical protein